MSKSLKILIADDNDSDRLILTAIVKKEGHESVTAANGQEAVDMYKEHKPDIVLLDALMPVMDGFNAARLIKEASGEDLVPIIFLTSLQDAASLAKCLDSGGDDFLSKPYNRIILKAKINAFSRMRTMHSAIQEHNKQLLLEQQVAKTIFDNVAHLGCLDAGNLKYSLSPLAVFNGDTVLAERKPDGGMYVFLGDFTGHGLPAAVGSLPLAEIFYGMTGKGFNIEEILREINQKLRKILPTGVFCCGSMIDMDFYEKSAKVWVGGLPNCFLYHSGNKEITELISKNLPLGVLDSKSFKPVFEEYSLDIGDRFFLWSDGIIESRNVEGEMFGEDRLRDVFYKCQEPEELFQQTLSAVDEFIGVEGVRDDDITVLEAKMVEHAELGESNLQNMKGTSVGPMDWELEFVLKAATLKLYNPLPLVLHIVTEVEGLRSVSGQLYTLLAELFSNALEHGVLNLSSELKKSTAGFAEYYQARTKALEQLSEGEVKVTLRHKPLNLGGLLTIRMEDTGNGFDHESIINRSRTNKEYSGRGLPLISKICDSFAYKGKGNIVEATIQWPVVKKI